MLFEVALFSLKIISSDSEYVFGIGADDHHSLGIWSIQSNKLLGRCSTFNATPPAIYDIVFNPVSMVSEVKIHVGDGDPNNLLAGRKGKK